MLIYKRSAEEWKIYEKYTYIGGTYDYVHRYVYLVSYSNINRLYIIHDPCIISARDVPKVMSSNFL